MNTTTSENKPRQMARPEKDRMMRPQNIKSRIAVRPPPDRKGEKPVPPCYNER